MAFARRTAGAGTRSATAQFDRLCKAAFTAAFPGGDANAWFRSVNGRGYHRGVRPDFVMPDGRWVDFKYRVSYRETHGLAWQPSALYSSLRKYIDHPANRHQTLVVVYLHLHGRPTDVRYPITRGHSVLIRNREEFEARIRFVNVRSLYERFEATSAAWVVPVLWRLP